MPERYPFTPLEALVLVDVGPQLNGAGQPAGRTRLVAEVLGVDQRQVIRWRQVGVTAEQADRLAVAAKLHPFEVWPEMIEDSIDDVTRLCDDCRAKFVPIRKDGRFCTPRCYRRWWAREVARRRRARPELAERNRQRRRAYYAENGEYERARERRRYDRARRQAA